MAKALISYTTTAGTYTFSTTGRTALTRKVDYDPDPGTSRAQRAIVNWSVKQEFAERSFADNHARYGALITALKTPEGVLLIKDENGSTLFSERVRVVSHNLPEQWGSYLMEVDVQFRSLKTDLLASAFNATFTPTGGSAVTLPNVTSMRDGVRTERPVTNVDNRRETIVTYTLSGRVQADASLDEEARRTALLAAKATILSIRDCANGTLVYASESHVVRIDQVDADIADGTEQLLWSVVASYRAFPDGSDVQVEYEVDSKQNLEKSEILLNVQGRVSAKTRAAAETRAGEIKVQYATEGRVLINDDVKVTLLDGEDGDDGWLSLSFNYGFREVLDVVSWDLQVSDRDDLKTANLITSYSGKVTAATSAAALAKARELGDGKYDIRVSSTETITTKSVGDSAEIFIECSFSYEYQRKGTKVYAEVSSELSKETFGNSTETISGFVVSSSKATSETHAATYKLAGRLLRTERMQSQDLHQTVTPTVTDQHIRVDFTFSYYLAHSEGSVSYSKEDAKDYQARTLTVTFSGTAWSTSAAACDTLIDALLTGETANTVQRDVRTTNNETAQSLTGFISRTFNITFSRTLTAVAGEDIINAEYTRSVTYSISMAVFTMIPYGVPYVESDVYQSAATLNISGSVTALTQASALAWAKSKRVLTGWMEEPPRVDEGTVYVPKSGTVVQLYRTNFQFSGRKATELLEA